MSLQAKYDPIEDRMLLSLQFGEDDRRTFWVTRRQWLGVLHEMAALQLVPVEDKAPPEPRKPSAKPLAAQPDAVRIDAMRLRKLEDGAKVVFVVGEEGLGLKLPRQGLERFHRMLEQQAERAGWDPRASIERLNAAVVARGVMRRAKGGE